MNALFSQQQAGEHNAAVLRDAILSGTPIVIDQPGDYPVADLYIDAQPVAAVDIVTVAGANLILQGRFAVRSTIGAMICRIKCEGEIVGGTDITFGPLRYAGARPTGHLLIESLRLRDTRGHVRFWGFTSGEASNVRAVDYRWGYLWVGHGSAVAGHIHGGRIPHWHDCQISYRPEQVGGRTAGGFAVEGFYYQPTTDESGWVQRGVVEGGLVERIIVRDSPEWGVLLEDFAYGIRVKDCEAHGPGLRGMSVQSNCDGAIVTGFVASGRDVGFGPPKSPCYLQGTVDGVGIEEVH